MCGRLNMHLDPTDLVDELDIDTVGYRFAPRYNVPPGAVLPIIIDRPAESGELVRRLESARWGLVPGWAKEEKIGFRAFNARSETVGSKPMFRSAFARQRCAVPVGGYYEWQTDASGAKTPWLMQAADGPLFMAGLFEFRKQVSAGAEADATAGPGPSDPAVQDGWLVSTTIITAPAAGHLAEVHDRMPVMITAADINAWADPTAGKDEAQELLRTLVDGFDPNRVERYRVDRAVGNVRNQSADLMAPVDEMRVP
ncbi:putative SOS response-associated peptidase YedK [Brevibacterium pityocampae]